MLTRRKLLAGFGVGSLSLAFPLLAQQGRVWRIGMLETQPMAANAANFDALRRGLRELGHVEGKNLLIEYRSADGRPERFPELAKKLVAMKVDLIVTRGTPATQAAKSATAVIPIVAATIGDPVSSGVVKSLSRPGGKVTGLNSFASELWAKCAQLLKETFPGVTRIGHLDNSGNALVPPTIREVEAATRFFGAESRFFDLRRPEDIEPAFDAATAWRAGALLVGIDIVPSANRKTIVALAAKHRLPALYSGREFVDSGGLISYGVGNPQLYFRAATYIDKIFKGAKPGDLPVEQPTKLELIINLRTAKALGVTIPAAVRLRADEVIE